ncbi:MAG: hypothetical protein QOI66_3437 [Myxococcales bacterium]|jgi:hypothetical protein|nr:hypothetical protein [Myxococcales bacterium]
MIEGAMRVLQFASMAAIWFRPHPGLCIDQNAIQQIQLDFDSGLPGRLEFFEVKSLNCPPSQDYCKGMIGLDLAITP